MTSPPEPISPEIVVPALTQAVGKLIRRVRSDADTGGLNLSQTAALARLDESGGMTNADLARAEAMKPQSMNAILVNLEQDGLVERRPHPTDGRQILFSVTAQGVEARRQWRMKKQDWLIAAVARLNPAEQQTLLSAARLIRRLADT
jgi:DNA-binding MarR family transcriptional regulator